MARRRVSQTALAKHIDISQTALSRRLVGEVDFTITEIAGVADFLKVPIESLVNSGT